MANNRMYLIHVPTGERVFLAKRLGLGWFGVPANLPELLDKLFESAEANGVAGQDDFALGLEDTDWNGTGALLVDNPTGGGGFLMRVRRAVR